MKLASMVSLLNRDLIRLQQRYLAVTSFSWELMANRAPEKRPKLIIFPWIIAVTMLGLTHYRESGCGAHCDR